MFGEALLYDETVKPFEWLFNSFVNTMNGKRPKTMLTDQDATMSKAIAFSWPETCHRLCVWHIYQSAARHLSGVFDQFKGFAKNFSSCVYDHDDAESFLIAREKMLERYNLANNEWLKRIFEVKEKWALVYGRQTFCADMSTTQRSESMNSQIKRYIDYKYDLLQFFHHFERLVEDRRYEELKSDCYASQTMSSLVFPVEILKHAAGVYTPNVFKIFHNEIWETWSCNIDVCQEIETCTKYKITPYNSHQEHNVTFDSCEGTVACSCKKFEFVGVLCSHALKVLSFKNIRRVPDNYILKRWTKDAKVGTTVVIQKHAKQTSPKTNMAKRYKDLSLLFSRLVAKAAQLEETFDIAIEGYKKIATDIDEKLKYMSKANSEVGLEFCNGMNSTGADSLSRPSNVSAVKGLKTKSKTKKDKGSKRLVSALEKATKNKRSRKVETTNDVEAVTNASSYSVNLNPSSVPDEHRSSFTNPIKASNIFNPFKEPSSVNLMWSGQNQ